jgi:hypothetical protein
VRSPRRAKKPKLGTMKGKVWELDPDWWKPMTEEETAAFWKGAIRPGWVSCSTPWF